MTVMTTGDDGGGRHFAGVFTRPLVAALRDRVGAVDLAEILERAGETRSIADLSAEATWSSYGQFRRLAEAASAVLAHDDFVAVGLRADDTETPHIKQALQRLGSPEVLLTNAQAANRAVCPIVDVTAEMNGPRDWTVRVRLAPGYEPFRELCAIYEGLQALGPVQFGYPTPSVRETACVRRGDPSCAYRVQWEDVDELTREATFLRRRVTALEGRLRHFEETVGDLVSGRDLRARVAASLAAATYAVHVPHLVLAFYDDAPAELPRVQAAGLGRASAEALAGVLLSDSPDLADGVWVDVASMRGRYGRLAALRPGGTLVPDEVATLSAHAGLIAAALDAAVALEDARQQGSTAHALLGLAGELAAISTVEEAAARIVRAVPAVTGCDRAAMMIADPATGVTRFVASHGYGAVHDARLRALEVPIPPDWLGRTHAFETAGPETERYHAMSGSEASWVIPIVVDGAWAGAVIAAVGRDADRMRRDPELAERLRGLAAQASTSIRNARLLETVQHQAVHDPLTGLPNRTLILDRVALMLARCRRQGRTAAAMFIDLDGFKEINDTLGHAAGDALLQAVTARLRGTVRPSDTVGRLGGDEFVVLVEGTPTAPGADVVAERILAVLREPYDLPGGAPGPLLISASVGIATGDRPTPGELLRDADIALYAAKSAGKNRYALFESEMSHDVQRSVQVQCELEGALARGELVLAYQPICDLATRAVIGVEALLRWQHPVRGELAPTEFVPSLESSGRILEVGRWVLHEATNRAAGWRADGFAIRMAVNVSGRQLQSDQLLDDVRDALEASGLPPEALVLELTESVVMADAESARKRLQALKELGVRLSMDDFGTGYSALAAVRTLPVDTLKIDRSFVAALGASNEADAVLHLLVQLGRALGLETVAEGIEEPMQYAALAGENCHAGQGFLVARPMTAAALEEFLHSRREWLGYQDSNLD